MLNGKIALVTGGAGALGSAVVETLLGAGATVVVPQRGAEQPPDLRQRLTPSAAQRLAGISLDLRDESAVQATYRRVAAEYGGIDLLINLAGGFAGGSPVHQSSWELWQDQLDKNLKTTVLSCAAAVPHMIERGGGAIVNVAARSATRDGANVAAYAAAKRAVMQLTEALASELRDAAITANTILPGIIDTPANRRSMPNADFSRWIAPSAIARVILFLVGPDARIISGAHLPV